MFHKDFGLYLRFILIIFFSLWSSWNFNIYEQNSSPLLIWCELLISRVRATEKSLGFYISVSAKSWGEGLWLWHFLAEDDNQLPAPLPVWNELEQPSWILPLAWWLATPHFSIQIASCCASSAPAVHDMTYLSLGASFTQFKSHTLFQTQELLSLV